MTLSNAGGELPCAARLKNLNVTRERLTENAAILGDSNADPLDVVKISMNPEERFDLNVPDKEWDRVKTVGDLHAAVSELLTRVRRAG